MGPIVCQIPYIVRPNQGVFWIREVAALQGIRYIVNPEQTMSGTALVTIRKDSVRKMDLPSSIESTFLVGEGYHLHIGQDNVSRVHFILSFALIHTHSLLALGA
jgi:hypothetical protein